MLSFSHYIQSLKDFLMEDPQKEDYEKLPLRHGVHDWGVHVPLDQIRTWEPAEEKFQHVIDGLKRSYKRFKESNNPNDLPQPIELDPNTGKIKLKQSGKIIDTGNEKFVVWDGHHRVMAAREAGLKTINARIRTSKTVGQV